HAVGQGAAADPARRVGADLGRRTAGLMDVRLSPEQVALRDAAAQVVDRLGVQTVAVLDDRERALKLNAPFLGATLAAELRRLAGAPPATEPETVALRDDLQRMASIVDGKVDGLALGPDASASSSALVLVDGAGGWAGG